MNLQQDIAIGQAALKQLQDQEAQINDLNHQVETLNRQNGTLVTAGSQKDATIAQLTGQIASLQDGDLSDEATQLDRIMQQFVPLLTNPPVAAPVPVLRLLPAPAAAAPAAVDTAAPAAPAAPVSDASAAAPAVAAAAPAAQ